MAEDEAGNESGNEAGGESTGGRDRLSGAAFGVGLAAALTGVVYFVAVPLGVVGLVLGVLALRRRAAVRRLALGGILLSFIGLAVGLGLFAFLLLDEDDGDGSPTVIDGIESGSNDTVHPPQLDLDGPVECARDGDMLHATGSVTNRTATLATYQLVVEWDHDGDALAEADAIVESVLPAGTRNWEARADVREVTTGGSGDVECRVRRIDRSTG
jgi:hypothetical protein